jgi:hypothetical protein
MVLYSELEKDCLLIVRVKIVLLSVGIYLYWNRCSEAFSSMIQNYKSHLPCHPNSTTTRIYVDQQLPGLEFLGSYSSICPPKVTWTLMSGVRIPIYFHQGLPGLDCLGFVFPTSGICHTVTAICLYRSR